MLRNVIASLNEWKRTYPAESWVMLKDFEQDDYIAPAPSLTAILREIERSVQKELPNPLRTFEEDWKPQLPPTQPVDIIPCRIVELTEEPEAICAIIMDRYEIPRVIFPARLLRRKGLQVGSRFNWLVRSPERVRLSDIDANVPQDEEMANVDRAHLEALYAEMQLRLKEDGGHWPVYTGDGK